MPPISVPHGQLGLCVSLGLTFASPRSHPHPHHIPTSTCACATPASADGPCSDNNLTRLGSTVNHDLLYPVSCLASCPVSVSESRVLRLCLDCPVSLAARSHHAAYHTGSTSVRADRPISPPFTLQAQYFAHRFNRAHLFVFSSLSITSTSFFTDTAPIASQEFSLDCTTYLAPGRFRRHLLDWSVLTILLTAGRPTVPKAPYHLRPAPEPRLDSRLLWHASGEFLSPNQTTGKTTTSPPAIISTPHSTQSNQV